MRHRKSFAIGSASLAFVTAASGFIVWKVPDARAFQESSQRIRALLQVEAEAPRLMRYNADSRTAASKDLNSYARHLETQRALIKSRLVLSAALRDDAVAKLSSIKNRSDRVAWLEQNLQVTNLANSELLQVALRSGTECSNEDQVAIVNAVVRSYMAQVAGA